jgi:hypothetical protein
MKNVFLFLEMQLLLDSDEGNHTSDEDNNDGIHGKHWPYFR